MWQDTDFTYLNQNNEARPVRIDLSGFSDPNNSPGAKGSYTTLGYAPAPGVDYSDQGHIYIAPQRFNPNPLYDTRPFATIRSGGLNPQHSNLDGMKPLSETVFHELLHIVGGTVAPNSGTLNIGDGPNKDTYGYEKCVKLGFDVTLGDPIDVADCIVIAAKALYLQSANPNNNPTWWTTGAVDPTTLNALNFPPLPGMKARQLALSWEA